MFQYICDRKIGQLFLLSTRGNNQGDLRIAIEITRVHEALGVRTLQTRPYVPFSSQRLEEQEKLWQKKNCKNNTSNREKKMSESQKVAFRVYKNRI